MATSSSIPSPLPITTEHLQQVLPFNMTRGEYLKSLENSLALELLPSLVILGFLAIVGNVGNAIALYVYYTRFKPSSTRTYILAMSVFDMLFNSLSLPGEILDLRFSMTYNARWLCRFHRFITVFLTLVSGFILVVVAVDRRRKICHPFLPPLTKRSVNLSLLACSVVAFVLGVPFSIMNGRHSVETEIPGVYGSACSVDDEFIHTSFPLVYNLILLLVFLVCAGAMITSYMQIARKVIRHKRLSTIRDNRTTGLATALRKFDSHASSGDHDSLSFKVKGSGHPHTTSDTKKKAEDDESSSGSSSNVSEAKHRTSCNVIAGQVDENHCSVRSTLLKAQPPNGVALPTVDGTKLQSQLRIGVRGRKYDENDDDEVFVTKTPGKSNGVSAKKSSSDTADKSSIVTPKKLHTVPAQTESSCSGSAETAQKSGSTRSQTGSTKFSGGSLQRVEEEFEVAVKTLAHAVSEDWLRSSEQFSFTTKNRLVRTRSRSVGDELFHVSYISEFIKQNHEERLQCTASAELRPDAESPGDVIGVMTSSHTQKGSEVNVDAVTSSHANSRSEVNVDIVTSSHAKNDSGEIVDTVTSSHTKTVDDGSQINGIALRHCDVTERVPSSKHKRRSSLPKDFRLDNHNDVISDTTSGEFSGKSKSLAKPRKTASASRADKLQSFARNTLRRIRSNRSELDHDDAEAGETSPTLRRHSRKKIPSRTTWMMFVLTAIFVISYLPYLAIISVRAVKHDVEVGLNGWRLNVYTIALKSYFINSVVNPVVYSFCSARFRHQCRHLLRSRKKFSISD